jgi:peptidoglycan hydrolase-like protein with peptidoglycan-binding domain
MPTLNIATMPTGVESRLLRIVQHLLLAWDINPGPDDGLPGPKTEAAVKEFQTICGLHVNGVVTGATWYELLSDE